MPTIFGIEFYTVPMPGPWPYSFLRKYSKKLSALGDNDYSLLIPTFQRLAQYLIQGSVQQGRTKIVRAFSKRFINHWPPRLGREIGAGVAVRRSSSLTFTCGSANGQWLVEFFEVLSTSQESLRAQCPRLHYQSKGDGVSHQGGCGGLGVSVLALSNNAPLWKSLFIEHDSLCLFRTGFRSPLGLWGFMAQALKQNIAMIIKEREQERKHMNTNSFSSFLWLKCIKNIDL